MKRFGFNQIYSLFSVTIINDLKILSILYNLLSSNIRRKKDICGKTTINKLINLLPEFSVWQRRLTKLNC